MHQYTCRTRYDEKTLQNLLKTLQKCFLCTTYIVILIVQPHNDMLPVSKG